MPSSIILSSFNYYYKNLTKYKGYSVARWQPTWFKDNKLETLSFLTATTFTGDKLKLSNFENPIIDYKKEYFKKISIFKNDFLSWIDFLNTNDNVIVLCCWCPHSKSSKKQLEKYGNFICHTGLIGRLINKYAPKCKVLLDDGHTKLNDNFIPYKYELIKQNI